MGVAGEFVDLLSRHRLSKDLIVHHTIEIIVGGIMADSSIRMFEPGFLFLVMMTVIARCGMVSLLFDHVSREGSSDDVFPQLYLSEEGRRRIFSVAGAVIVCADLIQPLICVFSYVFVYFEDLSESNGIWLPCLTAVFVAADLPLFLFFLSKTRTSGVQTVPAVDNKGAAWC